MPTLTRHLAAASILALPLLASVAMGACNFVSTDGLTGGNGGDDDASAFDATTSDAPVTSSEAGEPTTDAATDAADGAMGDDGGASDATIDAGPMTYPERVVASGPLAYWRFGETDGVVAYSEVNPGTYNGAYSGNYTLGVPGAIVGDTNAAVHFPGTNGVMDVGNVLGFSGAAAFTFEFWTRITAPPDGNYRRFFERQTNNTGQYAFLYEDIDGGNHIPGGQFGASSTTGSGYAYVASGRSLVDRWTYMVVTSDGTTMTFYQDTVPVAVTLAPTFVADAGALDFHVGGDAFSYNQMNGDIDELAVYDVALSADVIAAHFAAAGSHVVADAGASDAGDAGRDAAADASKDH